MSWLDDIIAKGKTLAVQHQQESAAQAASGGDFADTRVWLDLGEAVGTADAADRRGGPDRAHVTATVGDTRNYVMGLAGSGMGQGSAYMTLAQNLARKGALYDMRYASNVNSVVAANDTAMKMYLSSQWAGKIPYAQWLAKGPGESASTTGSTTGGGSSSGGGGGGSTAFTNVTVDLTNQFDARALVDNALNTYLGRDAKPKERARFWQQLNAKQAENPQVDSGVAGPNGTTRTGSGGFNKEIFAEDFAKSRDDYAETQASTTLLSRMEKLIMDDTTGSM